jgi:hypothetical protein
VRRVVGLLPRAELLVLDGAGHVPWFVEPARVAQAVTGCLVSARHGERRRVAAPPLESLSLSYA